VDHVDWLNGKFTFSTIDRIPATGFCGSGVVDLVAFLVNSKLIDDTGRMVENLEEAEGDFGSITVEAGENGPEIVFPEGPDTQRRLVFSQKDLREIQLAKAAMSAGVETLLKQADLSAEDVDTLWLAGGFGSYIRPESAAAIGLIPPGFADKTRSLGNAAARGALLCLLSREKYDETCGISKATETIELSGRPDFQNAYIEGMMFPVP
jgi:uncharacterized 2Fe-2S/4Fe-4S cluster protein (DUF4445 family)